MDFEPRTRNVNPGHVVHANVVVAVVDPPIHGPRTSPTRTTSIEHTDLDCLAVVTSSSRSRCATIEVASFERGVAAGDVRTPRPRCSHAATSMLAHCDFEHRTRDLNYGHVPRGNVEVRADHAPTPGREASATWTRSIVHADLDFGPAVTSSSRSRYATIKVPDLERRTRRVGTWNTARGNMEHDAWEGHGHLAPRTSRLACTVCLFGLWRLAS
jgi:hypothetical protein